MSNITMCGYRCDLCKAFAPNIMKNDQRNQLSTMWNKYFGFYIPPEEIYCDGCRNDKPEAKHLDSDCPVRKCVLEKGMDHCGECSEYPCGTFKQREGLCLGEAKKQQGDRFNDDEYNEFILAYDNKTTLAEYINRKHAKA